MKFLKFKRYNILHALIVLALITILHNLMSINKEKEGFKAFDDCKNGSYPFKFCINIPFNSEGLYKNWEELENNTRNYY